MWHTNLEFETIVYDSLGEEIDCFDERDTETIYIRVATFSYNS